MTSTPKPYRRSYHWHALYTRPRWEKKVQRELEQQGYIHYLPLVLKEKQWTDRKKKVEEPLIKSYIFVKVSEKEYYDVLNVDGAVTYVSFEGKAANIPEWQIEAVRKTIDNMLPFELTGEKLQPGEHVKIKEGNLKGLEGEILRIKGKSKLVIRIESVGYSLVVEMDTRNLW
jgi:transcription antitermination factor NusG